MGEGPHSDAYATASEGGLPAAGSMGVDSNLLNQLLTQMQNTAASVAQLQADMMEMKERSHLRNKPSCGARSVGSSSFDSGSRTQKPGLTGSPECESGCKGAGKRRRCTRTGRRGGRGRYRADRPAAPGRPRHRVGEDGQVQAGHDSALGFLDKGDSDRWGIKTPQRLSAVKATMLLQRLNKASMEADPASYVKAIESNAAQIMGSEAAGPMTMEKFVKDELLNYKKSLGYAAWAHPSLHHAQGRADGACQAHHAPHCGLFRAVPPGWVVGCGMENDALDQSSFQRMASEREFAAAPQRPAFSC